MPTTSDRKDVSFPVADLPPEPPEKNPDYDVQATSFSLVRGTSAAESVVTCCAVLLCVVARVPHRLMDAAGIRGWALALVVVVAVVNGARAVARAPFSFSRFQHGRSEGRTALREWVGNEVKILAVTVVVGVALTLPLYALLRATSAWWLLAWLMFAGLTIAGQVAMPLTLRAQTGPLSPAAGHLAERVRVLGARAGVDVGGGVFVGAKEGRPCNAYVAGLGPTRRIVLERSLAEWPPELIDQVVAHEIGHWRLRHAGTRLPLALAAQFVTLALAAWVLSADAVLGWGGVADAGDPRSYPLLLVLTPLLVLPSRALLAWRDRFQERAADRFALTLLDAPDHFAAMLERAAEEGGASRNLPWWRRLTASHPPIDDRARACMRFASTG
jgi:Zn-dependent protease with chaperone function